MVYNIDLIIMTSKTAIKKIIKSFQAFSKQTSFYQNRLPVIATNTEEDLNGFLDLMLFYMCAECGETIGKVYPRKNNWDFHHHCGLFNQTISKFDEICIFEGLMKAFNIYIHNKENPVDLEIKFANSFTKNSKHEYPKLSKLNNLLEYFFLNRNETFIKHGLENLTINDYSKGSIFPPSTSLMPLSLSTDEKSFAIEIDKPPFTKCFDHTHKYPWHYCSGIITLKDFQKKNGILKLADDREHFYAEANLSLTDWFFIYQTKTKYTKSLKFDVDLLRNGINQMKLSGASYIEIETLRKFFHVLSMLEQRKEAFELL